MFPDKAAPSRVLVPVNEVWDPEPGPCPAVPPGRPVYTADLRTNEKHPLCLSHGPPQSTRCRAGVNAMAPAGCSLMGGGRCPGSGSLAAAPPPASRHPHYPDPHGWCGMGCLQAGLSFPLCNRLLWSVCGFFFFLV